jgi:hypothetical protein
MFSYVDLVVILLPVGQWRQAQARRQGRQAGR